MIQDLELNSEEINILIFLSNILEELPSEKLDNLINLFIKLENLNLRYMPKQLNFLPHLNKYKKKFQR